MIYSSNIHWIYYHIFNSTGNFKKVLSATTLCQAVPFDFECTFVKQYFGYDKSHGLDYYEFSQLLQVHCIYICFSKRDTFLQNYFDQLRHNFVQEVSEIWYPGRAIINLLSYQILFAFCTKWWNDEQLKVSV